MLVKTATRHLHCTTWYFCSINKLSEALKFLRQTLLGGEHPLALSLRGVFVIPKMQQESLFQPLLQDLRSQKRELAHEQIDTSKNRFSSHTVASGDVCV